MMMTKKEIINETIQFIKDIKQKYTLDELVNVVCYSLKIDNTKENLKLIENTIKGEK